MYNVKHWVCTKDPEAQFCLQPVVGFTLSFLSAHRGQTCSVKSRESTAVTMCSLLTQTTWWASVMQIMMMMMMMMISAHSVEQPAAVMSSLSTAGRLTSLASEGSTSEQAAEGNFCSHVSQMRWSKSSSAVVIQWLHYAAVCSSCTMYSIITYAGIAVTNIMKLLNKSLNTI